MGYWENTTYIKHDRVADVADALDRVFEREGMVRVPAPPARQRMLFEPMQYDGALDNDVWGLALFPGAEGWSVLKTAPLELMAERAEGKSDMRLAALCGTLGTSAFQVHVYDSTDVVLVEVAGNGDVLMSGFCGQSADPMHWHGMAVTEERIEAAFELHDYGHLMAGNGLGDGFAAAVAREVGGRNAAFCDNAVSVETLICNQPFLAAGGMALYYRWRGPSRQRRPSSDTY